MYMCMFGWCHGKIDRKENECHLESYMRSNYIFMYVYMPRVIYLSSLESQTTCTAITFS